ncbi:MAG TPA: hypothetical protein VGY48_15570 [Vicinamibacterales bacterium]|jgi:hypothetical protein|nr:hypothetical protein [Vicinamibacterales bacterium]
MDARLYHAHTLISTLHPAPHAGALVEITGLMPKTTPVKRYFTQADLAAEFALELNANGYSSFVNTNPRDKFSSFEADVPYVTALALDLQPERVPIDTVLTNLTNARLPPSVVGISGFGYHAYLLVEPCETMRAKSVWERLCKWTVSDPIFSVNRIMRCAGTANLKRKPPAWCYLTGVDATRRYTVDFVEQRMNAVGAPEARKESDGIRVPEDPGMDLLALRKRISEQPGGEGILLIMDTGERNAYSEKQISRSEADWAVICALVRANASDEVIHWLYEKTNIRLLKYHSAGKRYLHRTIEAARRATAEKPDRRPVRSPDLPPTPRGNTTRSIVGYDPS